MAFAFDDYNPKYLMESYTEKALRKEYSNLRSIARKRLERLAPLNTETYQRYSGSFPALKDVKSEKELASRLELLEHFLNLKTSTVSGYKAQQSKTLETLHERGWDFVTKSNLQQFGQYMSFLNSRFVNIYSTFGYSNIEQGFQIYRELRSRNLSPETVQKSFEGWAQNIGVSVNDEKRGSRAISGNWWHLVRRGNGETGGNRGKDKRK